MNIAIVDDNKEQLEYILEQIREVWQKREPEGVFTAFSDVTEIYPLISEYDVVFMDIKMPEKDGITAATELSAMAPELIIVFVSDYDSYVWDSFRARPVYFLRKARLSQELPFVVSQCMDAYVKNNQLVLIDTPKETFRCCVRDIYYIEAQGRNISLCLGGEMKNMQITFSQIEDIIQNPLFLKVHRSYLVNSFHIQSLQKKQVILTNGEVLPVSKYRYNTVHEQYLMSLF